MAQTLIVFQPDMRAMPPLLPLSVHSCFLADTLALADQLRDVQVVSYVGVPGTLLTQALHDALRTGPTILLYADTPHLPIWRLRDAFSRLQGNDVVIGPSEAYNWYLLGMRRRFVPLLQVLEVPPEELLDRAHTAGITATMLPPWYRLRTVADFERLAVDLQTMPQEVAAHTRTHLTGSGLLERSV